MRKLLFFLPWLLVILNAYGQQQDVSSQNITSPTPMASPVSSTVEQLSSFSAKYNDKLSQKFNGLEAQLDKQTDKYLQKLEKQEAKLSKKLWKKDSASAKQLFGNTKEQYNELRSKAAEQAGRLNRFSKVYSSKLDSLGTAFNFLESNKLVSPELSSKISSSVNAINGIKGKLNQADQIKRYIKERRQLLTSQLEKFGLVKELKQFNKQAYYYQQQIREYKDLLENPDKLERKLLDLVSQQPAFKDFFAKNSELASLFNLPGSANNNPSALAGLQTRNAVMQDLQNRLGSGASVQEAMQQNLQSAQSQLDNLKNKIKQYLPQGGGNSDDMMPEQFKPNNQKIKNFWNRLEIGTNLQSQKPNGYFPVTSDIGLSVGYKLNERSITGIGASYKLGLGQDIRNIKLSHQGVGIRSFVDIKLKGSFWISGGYELNYQSEFKRVEQLLLFNSWQQSGLIGISKVVSVNSKVFKKTKLQILWDFLSYQQVPRRTPLVFRLGYAFK